jgi:hypothetical protein
VASASDGLKLRMFPLLLFGTAFTWFTSLAPNCLQQNKAMCIKGSWFRLKGLGLEPFIIRKKWSCDGISGDKIKWRLNSTRFTYGGLCCRV